MFTPFFGLHFQDQHVNVTEMDACVITKPLLPAWVDINTRDHFHLLPHADALHHYAAHLTKPGEEQLSRVLPAGLQADNRSGLGLPHHSAHHLALLLPCSLRFRAEC